jgi:hypothetical protein
MYTSIPLAFSPLAPLASLAPLFGPL